VKWGEAFSPDPILKARCQFHQKEISFWQIRGAKPTLQASFFLEGGFFFTPDTLIGGIIHD
jgi:hypothetical protein